MDPLDASSPPGEPPDAVVRYADHDDGVIDLFLPPTLGRLPAPLPLVVMVHGGFWRQAWDRTHLRPLASALVDRGLAVATPEYRRGPDRWPQARDDVATALSVVAGLVDEIAPGLVEPEAAYTLTGHSAGGHLALWGGLSAGSGRVRRVVALAPVSDLWYAASAGLGAGAARDFFGGDPDEVPDRYAEADPLRQLDGGVPVTIIQGTVDESVPAEMNRRVAADHRGVTYLELEGVDHSALIDPLSAAYRTSVWPALTGDPSPRSLPANCGKPAP